MLYNRPCNRKSVKGACTPPDFIEYAKAFFRCVFQDIAYLIHFKHKCALSRCKIIRSAYSCEYFINYSAFAAVRRNERANLRHQRNKRRLPHICRLACHVRSRYDCGAVLLAVKQSVVRDEKTVAQHFFNHRMPSALDFKAVGNGYLRLCIVIFHSCLGERIKHVRHADCVRRFRNALHFIAHAAADFHKFIIFELHKPLPCADNSVFDFLKLRRYIAFTVRNRLLSYIVIGNL